MARTNNMQARLKPLKYHKILGNIATGSFPTGYTKRLRPAETTVFTVDTTVPAKSQDSKSLKLALPGGGNINVLWDEMMVPGKDLTLQADVRFSVIGGDGNAGKIGILARASLNGFYVAYIKPSGNILRIAKFTGLGGFSETIVQAVTIPNFTATIDTWYTIKFQLNGTTLRAKAWPTEMNEPTAWSIDKTDATYTVGSLVGVWAYDGTEVCNSYIANLKSTDIIARTANPITRVVAGKQYLPTPYMDVDGGSGLPAGWVHYDDVSGAGIVNTIDAVNFVTGTGSHKMTLFNGSVTYKNNWTQVTLNVPPQLLKAGATFTAFVRYKQLVGTYSNIVLSGSGISDVVIATSSGALGWTTATAKVMIRKTVPALTLNIQCKNTNTSNTATLWVDEVRFYTPDRTIVT